ncbi:hypothetical protein, partial [Cupriavidus pauculus]
MPTITAAWGAVRASLQGEYFNDIKTIVGLAGLDLTAIGSVQQKQGEGGASKGQLMSAIDVELGQLDGDGQRHFVAIVAEELLSRKPDLSEQLADKLARHGWGLIDNRLVPLELFDPAELATLPDAPRAELSKAAVRFRDGDLAGAITAAFGAVEVATTEIYHRFSLGDPTDASFQERCNVALKKAADHEKGLRELGWDDASLKMFVQNRGKAFGQGAYVMQTLRSRMGDVHGTKPVLKPLVFEAL